MDAFKTSVNDSENRLTARMCNLCAKLDTIDDLPNEMLLKIFNYLGIRSLSRCKMVSKRWRTCANQVKVKELSLQGMSDRGLKKWFYTNDSIAEDQILRSANIFNAILFLHPSLAIPYDQFKLKRLHLAGTITDSYLNVLLNKCDLSQLEQLELEKMYLSNLTDLTLSLPSLRIFKVFDIVTYGFEFKINVNRLQVLGCEYGIDKIVITNPQSVQYIYNGYRTQYLGGYSGTQIYKCSWAHYMESDILNEFPNLIEFHLVKCESEKFHYEHVKATMDYLIEVKRQLRRNELKIYFEDTLIDDDKMFDDYNFKVTYQHVFQSS